MPMRSHVCTSLGSKIWPKITEFQTIKQCFEPVSPNGTLNQHMYASSMVRAVLIPMAWAETTCPCEAMRACAIKQWCPNVPCSFMSQPSRIKDPLPPPQQGEWPAALYHRPRRSMASHSVVSESAISSSPTRISQCSSGWESQ